MNTLFAKLSAALLVIVILMGSVFFVAGRINTQLYYEELTQRLNAPIAMYVTGQRDLISNGIPDLESLTELSSHAMVINPTAEIFLLERYLRERNWRLLLPLPFIALILTQMHPSTVFMVGMLGVYGIQILWDGRRNLRGTLPHVGAMSLATRTTSLPWHARSSVAQK